MLLDAQRQLADLNVQSRWAAMRLHRLEQKVGGLDQEQRKFANKLPHGKNLLQTSQTPSILLRIWLWPEFPGESQDRIERSGPVGGHGRQGTGGSAFEDRQREKPQARLALTDEFHKISKDVNQGKLPFPQRNPGQTGAGKVQARARPAKAAKYQKELTQLTNVEAPRTSELLNQKNLATLKQDIAKFPNAQVRSNLERRWGSCNNPWKPQRLPN